MEDFTEVEQRAAYFDGDPVIAQKKDIDSHSRVAQFRAENSAFANLTVGLHRLQ